MAEYDIASQRRIAKEAFNERRIRQEFIRKVCLIIMVQLALTLGAMFLAATNDDVKLWLLEHQYLMIFALFVLFTTVCSIACCGTVRKEPPCNYILLAMFTAAEIFILSFITCLFPSGVILMAVGITAALTFALTMFALQTKIDFTAFGGTILVFTIAFVMFALVVAFFPSKTLIYIKASAGAVLVSIFLIFDIQAMMGGDGRSMVLHPDDFILAAVCIYTDIIYLFLQILTLLSND